MSSNNNLSQEFKITRTFNAPREQLFEVWTNVDDLKVWIGLKNSSVEYLESEVKPGGTVLYSMTFLGGANLWEKFSYQEIDKPNRLVYVQACSNEKGEITRHRMIPAWPLELLTQVVFEEEDDQKTRLTLNWNPINPTEEEKTTFQEEKEGMDKSWGRIFTQLEKYLETK